MNAIMWITKPLPKEERKMIRYVYRKHPVAFKVGLAAQILLDAAIAWYLLIY